MVLFPNSGQLCRLPCGGARASGVVFWSWNMNMMCKDEVYVLLNFFPSISKFSWALSIKPIVLFLISLFCLGYLCWSQQPHLVFEPYLLGPNPLFPGYTPPDLCSPIDLIAFLFFLIFLSFFCQFFLSICQFFLCF